MWMATFADMAILLMAFFALLYSFTEINIMLQSNFAASIRAAFGVDRKVVINDIPTATSMLDERFAVVIAKGTPLSAPFKDSDDTQRRYRKKYTLSDIGDFSFESDYRRLTDTLSEAMEKGDALVRVEDEQIIVELQSLFTSGGTGELDDGLRKGARVRQSTIDIAAKVLSITSQMGTKVELRSQDLRALEAAKDRQRQQLKDQYDAIVQAFEAELSKGTLKAVLQTDRLSVRLASQDSFISGRADLTSEATDLIARLARTLSSAKGKIRVEGHTDNIPVMYSESFMSNWDLSTARASSVAAAMIDGSSIRQARLEIAGFADSKPIGSNATRTGRAANRRIEIIVTAATADEVGEL
jgi:chemotaxis protein MotB